MAIGSAVLVLLASGLALATALLSPTLGLIAVAFLAPFPRPPVIPTPGLYVALIGAIGLGLILRMPVERPRLHWPSPVVWLIGAFLLYIAAHLVGGLLDGAGGPDATTVMQQFSQVMTGVLAFIVTTFVLSGRSPFPVLAALLVSAAVVAATAIAQSMGLEGLFGRLVSDGEFAMTIGRVTGVRFDPEALDAEVTFVIDSQYDQIPEDSDASILTAGLLGSQYIGLQAGGSDMYLEDGSEIQFTQSAIVLENLISKYLFSAGGDSE